MRKYAHYCLTSLLPLVATVLSTCTAAKLLKPKPLTLEQAQAEVRRRNTPDQLNRRYHQIKHF